MSFSLSKDYYQGNKEARSMSPEVSASASRLAASHDGNANASQGNGAHDFAVAVGDVLLGTDDAGDKNWSTKMRKRGIGSLFWRTIFPWNLVVCAMVVMALIAFPEVRRLFLGRPSSVASAGGDGRMGQESLAITDGKLSNLDNMDMTFKKGLPCLDLLPVEELTKFQLPPFITSSPIKALNYVERKAYAENWLMDERFIANPFVGNQSMQERASTYKVQAAMTVHCGFCDGENQFTIDARDKVYLAECQIVVLTCTFGGQDDLYQPIGMTLASKLKVCYVAFWDEVTLDIQANKGVEPDLQTRQVGLWRVVVVHDLPFSDQRRNGKIPKLLNHRLFPQARYSIWVDSKNQFRRDPIGVIEALLLRPKAVFAISEHGGRNCVYKEGEAIVIKHKALPDDVSLQLDQYHKENFPENAQFDGHKALAEASIIVREHTPLTNLLMCNWFNEVMRFTARDQLSFPYVLVKLEVIHPNMFSVCTRRALVNTIGHTGKKPKPLNPKWD